MSRDASSYADRVKEELLRRAPKKEHCRQAEIEAILLFSGEEMMSGYARRRLFTLQEKTATIGGGGLDAVPEKSCCRRALLRGAFLAAGSVSDPARASSAEFVCRRPLCRELLLETLRHEGIDHAGLQSRRGRQVLYLRDGTSIVTLLGLIEAPGALMEFENARIYKEMRSGVNRQVNCEAANISKTVSASLRQREDILFIQEHGGLSQLPQSLWQIAALRLAEPEFSLEDLGRALSPPLGKSGVNHRMRRLHLIAESLRENN